jgi:hypothetical protein
MTDRFLTVVFRNPTPEETQALTSHDKASAMSWGHALDERDMFAWRMTKMLNETTNLND